MSSSTGIEVESDLIRVFGYSPNQPLSITAMVLFGLFFFVLSFQGIYYKRWYTLWLPVAAAGEFIGFYYRYKVVDAATTVNFVLTTIFILVMPNLLALVNYSTVGRILRLVPAKPRDSTWLRIPIITDWTGQFIPGRIAVFFFISDIFAFVIQASSAAFLTSSDPNQVKTGQNIILAGLAWAVAFIALFFFVTLYVYFSPRYSLAEHPHYKTFQYMFFALISTITLLLVRSVYRLIDYGVGQNGYVSHHEGFLYAFDTLLILVALLIYAIFPFGKLLQEVEGTPQQTDVVTVVPKPTAEEEMEMMEGGGMKPTPTGVNNYPANNYPTNNY